LRLSHCYGEKTYVSWHYTIDDSQIIKHLPINEKGFHVLNDGNTRSIGIEICMNKGIDQDTAFLTFAKQREARKNMEGFYFHD